MTTSSFVISFLYPEGRLFCLKITLAQILIKYLPPFYDKSVLIKTGLRIIAVVEIIIGEGKFKKKFDSFTSTVLL
jgi:hypothetical protein